MRNPAAMMVRASFAIATVAAAVVMASSSASAQDYFVNGRPASAIEARYLAAQGMPAGNWQIDGWGISPAVGKYTPAVASNDDSGKCWYVLDVPLGDCGAASRAIARNEPAVSGRVEVAAADASGQAQHQVRHAGSGDE